MSVVRGGEGWREAGLGTFTFVFAAGGGGRRRLDGVEIELLEEAHVSEAGVGTKGGF